MLYSQLQALEESWSSLHVHSRTHTHMRNGRFSLCKDQIGLLVLTQSSCLFVVLVFSTVVMRFASFFLN